MAMEWTVASELPAARKATPAEAKALNKEFGGAQIMYNFEDGDFLNHDGDLLIDGNFDCDARLVVRGNLKVKGLYNDYQNDIGVLLVTGNMSAHQLYSWGALYVGKDLNVAGLALTIYNDFTFEVAGKVNARALVISDKSADYTAGKIAIELNDMGEITDADMDNAVRGFLPELFTKPSHFEPEIDDFYGLNFDNGEALERMSAGRPIFREKPAAAGLVNDVNRMMSSDLSEIDQAKLLVKDRLLAQMLASRPDLSDAIAKQLAALKDPTINDWLAASKPELIYAQSVQNSGDAAEISPKLAASLAGNPATSLATLAKLAEHSNAGVRVALAKFSALPDTAPGRALVDKLVLDTDASVRAGMLDAFGFASAFGWALSDSTIDERLKDTDQATLNALAFAHLNAAQVKRLMGKLDGDGALLLAISLREQAEQARPTRLSSTEITGFARQIVARPVVENEYGRASTEAFFALPAAEQASAIVDLVSRKAIDVDNVMRESNSHAVLEKLAALSLENSKMISDKLAENPFLPAALQLQIVQLAKAAKPKAEDDYADHPIDALEELLGNDANVPEAMNQAVDLALERGLQPADGSYQNALFHADTMTPQAIAKLDARLSSDDDWALTLMGQPAATVAQRVKSLRRWYDDDADLQKSLSGAESLSLPEFYLRAAQSASIELQKIALQHVDLPLELVKSLQASADTEVAQAAMLHPQIALDALPLAKLVDVDAVKHLPRKNPDDWLRLSELLSSLSARAAARARYAQMLRKAVP